jgi:tetratricopeptide (TPR) repeat protein
MELRGVKIAGGLLGALLFTMVAGWAAAGSDEAKERFFKGKEMVEQGEFGKAIVEFKESYKLKPTAVILYNIAMCHEELHQYAKAILYLNLYLDKKGKDMGEEEKAKIEASLKELEKFVGKISVLVNEPGATVRVDGEFLGLSEELKVDDKGIGLGKEISGFAEAGTIQKIQVVKDGKVEQYDPEKAGVGVDIGKHDVTVTKEGFSDWKESVEVISGKTKLVTVDLVPLEETNAKTPIFKKQAEIKKASKETVTEVMKGMMKPVLHIASAPEGALVAVDGEKLGGKPPYEKTLEPGKHKVFIKAEGYEDWGKEMDVGPAEKAYIYADLKKIEKAGAPKEGAGGGAKGGETRFGKVKSLWWMWAIIGVVVGGAIAGGIAAGVSHDGGDAHGSLDTRYPD